MSAEEGDLGAVLTQARPFFVASWRIVLSVTLIGAYLAALMTGVAQQRIIESLASVENGSKIGYNEALNVLQLSEAQVKQRADGQTAAKVISNIERQISANIGATRTLDQRFNDVAGRATDLGCPAAAGDGGGAKEAIKALQEIRRCANRNAAASSSGAQLKELADDAGKLIDDYNSWLGIGEELEDKLKDAKRALEDEKALGSTPLLSNVSPDKLQRVFSEVYVIRNGLGPLGGITSWPPFALQVLLALLSGCVGALLVALVLIVYPHNKISLGRSANFEATLALGGLVAICIYLTLGAGSSVLGAPLAGADAAKVNVSALSFICLLAGAFSDQVADWLSNRATTLFLKQDREGSDKGGKPAPKPADRPAPSDPAQA